MKAISLWQPWASAMASGMKRNETRSWATSYRGPLVICSAKRKPRREEMLSDGDYAAALEFPYGFALCVVDLLDCVPTEWFENPPRQEELSDQERELGDYTPGRFAWLTGYLRKLGEPLPVVGRQGLWTLDAEMVKSVTERIQ